MEKKNLKEVSIEELISYSKQKDTPAVTIIDNVSEREFKYINLLSDRLFIEPIIVKETNMIAFIGNSCVLQKIARDLKRRSQTMYYDFIQRPSGSITIYALTGYTDHWKIIRNNGYQIIAYDENGLKIEPWINTNVKAIEPKFLNSLCFCKYKVSVYLNGIKRNINVEILEHSIQNFLNDGIYNEERNCYYPSENSNKDIAEKNKINKLFKKLGLRKL